MPTIIERLRNRDLNIQNTLNKDEYCCELSDEWSLRIKTPRPIQYQIQHNTDPSNEIPNSIIVEAKKVISECNLEAIYVHMCELEKLFTEYYE